VVLPEAQPVEPRVEHRFDLSNADFLAAEAGSLWVRRAQGIVERIDPATNSVVTSVKVEVVASRGCSGLGAGEGAVWSCVGEGAVARIDPASSTVVATVEVAKAADQTVIPVTSGHAWVLSEGGQVLIGVSTEDNAVHQRVELDSPCTDVAAGAGALWVVCFTAGQVLRVDPEEAAVTARIGGLPAARTLAAADAVYVGFADGIARIDPTTNEVTAAVDVPAGAFLAGIAATPDDVWVHLTRTFLQRLDPTTLEVTEVLLAPEPSGGSVLAAYGSVWATAVKDAALYRVRAAG
jgi:streptogramin lyase